MLVREQHLLTEVLERLKAALPFALVGIDTDNDTVFINETVKAYCEGNRIEFTRCRPYRKNDQAYVEQKNGAVVRRLVGYRRLEGTAAARELARLYAVARLCGRTAHCARPRNGLHRRCVGGDRAKTHSSAIGPTFGVGSRLNLISPVVSCCNAFRPIIPVRMLTASSAPSSAASRRGEQKWPADSSWVSPARLTARATGRPRQRRHIPTQSRLEASNWSRVTSLAARGSAGPI